MFQILNNCATDISSCCSDYALAGYLNIIQKCLNLIQIVVPIILIVMGIVQLTKLVMDPNDKAGKAKKSLINKFAAAVIVFLLPIVMDVILSLVAVSFDSFELGKCWQAADNIVTIMNETGQIEYDDYNPTPIGDTYSGVNIQYNDTTQTTPSSNNKNNKNNKKNKNNKQKEREDVVEYAKKFLGNRYVYGGTSLTNGIDCSGFTMKVYKEFGYNIPRTSYQQAAASNLQDVSFKDLKKGDLIFYSDGSRVNHVAIYIGNGKIIHASNPRSGIKISNYNYRSPYKAKRVIK